MALTIDINGNFVRTDDGAGEVSLEVSLSVRVQAIARVQSWNGKPMFSNRKRLAKRLSRSAPVKEMDITLELWEDYRKAYAAASL